MPSVDEIRAHLTPERADDKTYLTPEKPSDWEALTDDEVFRLARKLAAANYWNFTTQLDNEMASRLVLSLGRLREASDRASRRLEALTWALVLLTLVIAGFTIALFFHD